MFGFCCPPVQDLEYRSIYSRCCQYQRLHYGALSIRFNSYESVLLLACAADANPAVKAAIPIQSCCRLRAAISGGRAAADQSIGLFVSSLSMVLAATKMADDLRDFRSQRARLGQWLMRNKIAKAYSFFQSIDANFAQTINGYLAQQEALETSARRLTLGEYAAVTAMAFSYLFGLAAAMSEMKAHREFLSQLGSYVGAAMVSFDCVSDSERDRRTGQFNPLESVEEVSHALAFSRNSLEGASDLCARYLGEGAVTTKTLRAIFEQTKPPPHPSSICGNSQETLELLGLTPSPGFVYTRSCCGDLCGGLCICMVCLACLQAGSGGKVVHVYHHRNRYC